MEIKITFDDGSTASIVPDKEACDLVVFKHTEGNTAASVYKALAAAFITRSLQIKKGQMGKPAGRSAAEAITQVEDGAMWAVKSVFQAN